MQRDGVARNLVGIHPKHDTKARPVQEAPFDSLMWVTPVTSFSHCADPRDPVLRVKQFTAVNYITKPAEQVVAIPTFLGYVKKLEAESPFIPALCGFYIFRRSIMGWSFACDTRHDKKACVAKLTRPARFSAGYTMLRHSVVGNHLWTLIKCPDDRVIVGLDLMAGGGKQGMGWGLKGMDEESGPYSYDCPLSFLDAASEPRGSAIEWRRAVRAHHANKKINRPYISQVVSFGSEQYLLLGPAGPHRGWLVHGVSDGAALRMNSKQLARSEVV